MPRHTLVGQIKTSAVIGNDGISIADLEALPQGGLEDAADVQVLHLVCSPLTPDHGILQQLARKRQVVQRELSQPVAHCILFGYQAPCSTWPMMLSHATWRPVASNDTLHCDVVFASIAICSSLVV